MSIRRVLHASRETLPPRLLVALECTTESAVAHDHATSRWVDPHNEVRSLVWVFCPAGLPGFTAAYRFDEQVVVAACDNRIEVPDLEVDVERRSAVTKRQEVRAVFIQFLFGPPPEEIAWELFLERRVQSDAVEF